MYFCCHFIFLHFCNQIVEGSRVAKFQIFYTDRNLQSRFFHKSSQKWLDFTKFFCFSKLFTTSCQFFAQTYPSYPWHFATLESRALRSISDPNPKRISKINFHLTPIHPKSSSLAKSISETYPSGVAKKFKKSNFQVFLFSTLCITSDKISFCHHLRLKIMIRMTV